MPSPATTNITIGSILDLLAPTALPVKDGSDQTAFDSLLQPATPQPPPCPPRQSETPAHATARQAGNSTPPTSPPERSDDATISTTEDAGPEESAQGEVEAQTPGDDELQPTVDSAPDDTVERCEEEVFAESLAAL